MAEEPSARLSVGMVGPERDRCGVADYTCHVVDALRRIAEVRYLVDPSRFGPELPWVEIVHVQHQYFLFGGVAPWRNWFPRFARRLRSPAVMTVHEIVPPSGSPLRRAAIRLTNRLQFQDRRIRRLIVHTEQDRTALLGADVAPERLTVVRHGVPTLPPLPDRDAARRALGVEHSFVVALLGFLSRKKGHTLALDALRNLPREVVLLIAGGRHPDDTTSYADELYAAATQPDVAGRARITGYLPEQDLLQALSASDLVVAPFTETSGSGSLALAFAAGKPIVASDIRPHREMLQETPGTFATFQAGDADDLAKQIDVLRRDADALDGLREASCRYAREHSYARAAEETVELYRSVLIEERE